jgi:hypothetical protein
MHLAKIESSKRLQRVYECLKRHPLGVSSMTLIEECYVVAPGTVVSELRHQGYKIGCQREGKAWIYRLEA